MEIMKREFIARVRNGRLVLDEPTELPEGTELALGLANPEAAADAVDRARLDAALRESEDDIAAGRLTDGRTVIAELRRKR